jgi:hypothetical protein
MPRTTSVGKQGGFVGKGVAPRIFIAGQTTHNHNQSHKYIPMSPCKP